tara:strand:- start:1356 stop:1496 length:141 start_codon:yes stop_codon:yes gene_type:complete
MEMPVFLSVVQCEGAPWKDGKHMIPRMAGLPGYDRAAAAIWLHEKP